MGQQLRYDYIIAGADSAGCALAARPCEDPDISVCLPYCAAMVLLTGDLTIADLDNTTWQHDEVRQIIAKTSVSGFKPRRPELNFDPEQPDQIVIKAGGEIYAADIPYPLGAPQKPMPETRHFNKFRLNAGLDEASAKQIWQKLKCWPEAKNIHDLFTVIPVQA